MCGAPDLVDAANCYYNEINAIIIANIVAASKPDYEMPPVVLPLPTLSLPEIEIERDSPDIQERLGDVEVDVWKCLFDDPDSPTPLPRSLTMAIGLDAIRIANGKLRIIQQDSILVNGNEVRATHQRYPNEDLVRVSRRKIMESAADDVSDPNDSTRRAAEKRMYYKHLAQTYVHEVCHGNPNHGEPGTAKTLDWYENTNIGQCELDSFLEIFGETPPDYQDITGAPGTFPDNSLPLPSDTTANEALRCLAEIQISQAAQSGQGIHHIQYSVELLETAPNGTPIVWGI